MKEPLKQLLEVRTLRLESARRTTLKLKTELDTCTRNRDSARADLKAFEEQRAREEREAFIRLREAPVAPSHLLRHRDGLVRAAEQEAEQVRLCENADKALKAAYERHAKALEEQRERERSKEKVAELVRRESKQREREAERTDEETTEEWVSAMQVLR